MTMSKQFVLQSPLTVITLSAPLTSFHYLNWLSFCHLLRTLKVSLKQSHNPLIINYY